jgi:hypothetical protein
VIILIWEVLLVVGKVTVKLQALLEVLYSLEAANVLEEVKVAVSVNTSTDKSVPVDALKLNVGIVDLEVELKCLIEVDVGTFDGVHIFTCRLKLVEVEVFWEHFHFNQLIIIMSQTITVTLLKQLLVAL